VVYRGVPQSGSLPPQVLTSGRPRPAGGGVAGFVFRCGCGARRAGAAEADGETGGCDGDDRDCDWDCDCGFDCAATAGAVAGAGAGAAGAVAGAGAVVVAAGT